MGANKGLGSPFCANKGSGSPRSRRGSGLSGSNLLSGDDNKESKYQQQTRSRRKKLLGLGLVLVAVISVANKKHNSASNKNKSDEPSLRGDSGSSGNNIQSRISALFSPPTPPPTSSPTQSPTSPPTPPPSHPPTNNPTTQPTSKPSTAPPTNKPTAEPIQPLQTVTIEKGSSTSICGHPIPLDLSDHAKWPTPYTPILKGGNTPESKKDSKQVTLLKKDKPYAGIGAQLNSLFHAFDYSYANGLPLYITEDSWALTSLFQLFFGNIPLANNREANSQFFSTIQETLGVTEIIENEDVLQSKKLEVPKATPPEWLYGSIAKDFTKEQIRDHRNTILRKLFMHPLLDVCTGLIDTVLGADKKNKIVVIHIASGSRELLPEFNKSYGKDQSAAVEMTPDYIKTILKQIGDKDHDIYLIDGDGDGGDIAVHDQFAKDPELKGKVKAIKAGLGEKIYLATLAEAFIGNPVSQMGLWIARFRMALGMGENTFVLTEKKGDRWESLLSQVDYLDLYDQTKLGGPWMA